MLDIIYTILGLTSLALLLIICTLFFIFKIARNPFKYKKYQSFVVIMSIVLCILLIAKIIIAIILQTSAFTIVLDTVAAVLWGYMAISRFRSLKNDINITFDYDENKKDYIDVPEEDIHEWPDE